MLQPNVKDKQGLIIIKINTFRLWLQINLRWSFIGIMWLFSSCAYSDLYNNEPYEVEQSEKILLSLKKCHYSPASLATNQKPKLTIAQFKALAKKEKIDLCRIELIKPMLLGAELKGIQLREAKLNMANLVLAELQGANLTAVDFQDVDLGSASLQGANLRGANLQKGYLFNTNLQNTDMSLANLLGADLGEAKLHGANLSNVKFGCVGLQQNNSENRCTDISRATFYGPECTVDKTYSVKCDEGKLVFANFIGAKGIKSMVYDYSEHYYFPASLFPLREYLRKNGHEREAREITYVIAHGAIKEALYQHDVKELDASMTERVGAYVRYLAFDLTVEFGVNPGGAIKTLGVITFSATWLYFLMFVLILAYPGLIGGSLLLVKPKNKFRADNETLDIIEGEFYAVDMLKRVRGRRCRLGLTNIEVPDIKGVNNLYKSLKYNKLTLAHIFWHSLWFSILSSFHFGWRDLNIGNWLTRLQPKVFTYKPTGIFRTLSGLQSLLCIYLLALFMLSYFGHPWG